MANEQPDSLSFNAYKAIWHAANELNGGTMPDEIVAPLSEAIETFLAHAKRINDEREIERTRKQLLTFSMLGRRTP